VKSLQEVTSQEESFVLDISGYFRERVNITTKIKSRESSQQNSFLRVFVVLTCKYQTVYHFQDEETVVHIRLATEGRHACQASGHISSLHLHMPLHTSGI